MKEPIASLTYYFDYDGLIEGEPYKVVEFNKEKSELKGLTLEFSIFDKMDELTAIQKLVYIVIHEFSFPTSDDGLPMYFFRISIEDLAELLHESANDINLALVGLIELGKIRVFRENGKIDAYTYF